MDDLDALLAEATADVEKAKGEKRKAHSFTGAFVESDFRPVAFVAMIDSVVCHRCGVTKKLFEGLFEERAHRIRPTELHLVRLPTLPVKSTLPHVRRFREHYLPYCEECVDLDSYKEQS